MTREERRLIKEYKAYKGLDKPKPKDDEAIRKKRIEYYYRNRDKILANASARRELSTSPDLWRDKILRKERQISWLEARIAVLRIDISALMRKAKRLGIDITKEVGDGSK